MEKILGINRSIIILGILLSLFGISILLMESKVLEKYDFLSLAITIDLLLTIPFIYFLLIRKTTIPKTTVIPIIIVGLVVGSYFMPKENQFYLTFFKIWILPIVEISILTYIIFKVKNLIKKFNSSKTITPDFFTALIDTCNKIFPKKIAYIFATEIAVIYYAFINWKTRKINDNEFTYHKDNTGISLFGGLILIIVVETVGLHFLLDRWSAIAAWILTGASIYTIIQVFGFAKSISRRPIIIENDTLILRYGIINETIIHISDIETIALSKKELEKDKLTKTLSPLGDLESHNVIVNLKKENTLIGLYGIKKTYKVIGLHIDTPDQFKEKIDKLTKSN